MDGKTEGLLAAPCGLYCGACADRVTTGECHRCGCTCGTCAGQAHAGGCRIASCVSERGIESCDDCEELPCSDLIQFAFDPIWRTHLPVIENLRRRARIGTDRWLVEQARFFADPKRLARELRLHGRCAAAWRGEQGRG